MNRRTRMTCALSLLLVGCEARTPSPLPREDEASGISYKEGNGLLVTDATKAAIGLETAEVEEGLLHPRRVKRGTIEPVPKQSGRTRVVTHLKPDEASRVRTGQHVSIEGVGAKGVVTSVSSPDPLLMGDREAVVEFDLDRPLTEKMVNLVFEDAPVEAAAIIPKRAVLTTTTGAFAYARNGDYLFRTPLKTGQESEDSIEVVEGLYPGDVVVTNPVMTLWLAELQAIKGGVGCADGH